MIPAKGKGTPNYLQMPSDSLVASHLVLGPAQSVFDVFVALLHPPAQSVQPDHLFQTGWRKRWFAGRGLSWCGQVGDQVAGRQVGQRLRVGRGHEGALRLVWSIRPGQELHRPPLLGAAIAAASRDPHPLSWVLGI